MPNRRSTTTSHSKLHQCMKVISSRGNLVRTNIIHSTAYVTYGLNHDCEGSRMSCCLSWLTHTWRVCKSLAACEETVRITEQINSYDRRLVENHDPWINAISMRSFTLYSITTANAWLAADWQWQLCLEFADEILIVNGLKRRLLDQEASFF